MDKYLSQISGWNDHDDATEKRFEFLFSNLPAERTALNCYSYDEKLAFWKMHLIETSKLGLLRGDNLFQIELSSAISRFSRNGLYPGCMKTVFESLENEGIIQHSDTWKRRLVRHGLAMRMVMLAADQVITAGRKMFGKARTLLFPFSDNGRPGLNPLGPDNDYILVEFLKASTIVNLRCILSPFNVCDRK